VAVPKRRKSRSKRDMRRAQHDKVAAPTLVACPNCGERRACRAAPRLRVMRSLQGPGGQAGRSFHRIVLTDRLSRMRGVIAPCAPGFALSSVGSGSEGQGLERTRANR
jgi:ribosomal protein L32